jgi:hypothetical protein
VTKNTSLALLAGIMMLAFLIGAAGCLVAKSESDSLMTTARKAINTQIGLLDEQDFDTPLTPVPLDVAVDSVESNTHRIGRDSVDVNVNMDISGGIGIGAVGGGGG